MESGDWLHEGQRWVPALLRGADVQPPASDGQEALQERFSPCVPGPLHEDALTIPFGWRSPRLIFVNSMSDLFQKDVPLSFIQQVFKVMTACPHHTFQILTKRRCTRTR